MIRLNNYSFHGIYKPTNITGGPHIVCVVSASKHGLSSLAYSQHRPSRELGGTTFQPWKCFSKCYFGQWVWIKVAPKSNMLVIVHCWLSFFWGTFLFSHITYSQVETLLQCVDRYDQNEWVITRDTVPSHELGCCSKVCGLKLVGIHGDSAHRLSTLMGQMMPSQDIQKYNKTAKRWFLWTCCN